MPTLVLDLETSSMHELLPRIGREAFCPIERCEKDQHWKLQFPQPDN